MVECQYQMVIISGENSWTTTTVESEHLGMKQSQYSRYERGHRDIPTDVLIRLAFLYDTSTDYLLGITDVMKPYARLTDRG